MHLPTCDGTDVAGGDGHAVVLVARSRAAQLQPGPQRVIDLHLHMEQDMAAYCRDECKSSKYAESHLPNNLAGCATAAHLA